MIFLNRQRGQAVIESIGAIAVMLLVLVPGIILMLHGLGTLILTKWASRTSHCVAQSRPIAECTSETKLSLIDQFVFHNVDVRVTVTRGIIHSAIDAHLLEQTLMKDYNGYTLLRGTYDLNPSEYKRVK